jgi:hypothetical protein
MNHEMANIAIAKATGTIQGKTGSWMILGR